MDGEQNLEYETQRDCPIQWNTINMHVNKSEIATHLYQTFNKIHKELSTQSEPKNNLVVVTKEGKLYRMDEEYGTFGMNCWKKTKKAHHNPKSKIE